MLLRVTVGITAAMQAWSFVVSAHTHLLTAIPAAALVVCGVALTAGLFTSLCSTLVALGYALALVLPFGGAMLPRLDGSAALVGFAATVALGLVGPGAFSVDARLFGRREIFIPANDGSE